MVSEEKNNELRKIFWDVNLPTETLYSILIGRYTDKIISREKIFIRMLERLNWHTILKIAGIDVIKELLTKEVIAKLRHPEMRERYEFIRKILFGEAVSFTGWCDEYYQKIKHTLFSNRWYRSQQTLL